MQELFPAPDLESLLMHCRHAPEIVCLDGGRGGWKYLALPQSSRWLASLDDLPEVTHGSADTSPRAWPAAVDGGCFIQCDYGLPVGMHAAEVAHGQYNGFAGRLAYLRAWIAWDPQGRSWLMGDGPEVDRLRQIIDSVKHVDRQQAWSVSSLQTAPQPAWSAEAHQAKVDSLRQAITAGVCFQGNLTIPFRAAFPEDNDADIDLFCKLRRLSPAPYAMFWRQAGDATTPGRSICSHSPECYLQGDGQGLRSEPIKGTRARLPGAEQQVRAELLASAKDRAELAMIVDLVRNDLGRIAEVGTVQVRDSVKVMDLDYVHHTLAEVLAIPRADTGINHWLAASFPPGSITGAPKIEVMKLLQELEGEERGPYCGCFGWLGYRSCALAVAIRTMVVQGGQVQFSAGGGIVADSQPLAEWGEVLAKASRMFSALGDAS